MVSLPDTSSKAQQLQLLSFIIDMASFKDEMKLHTEEELTENVADETAVGDAMAEYTSMSVEVKAETERRLVRKVDLVSYLQ